MLVWKNSQLSSRSVSESLSFPNSFGYLEGPGSRFNKLKFKIDIKLLYGVENGVASLHVNICSVTLCPS